MDGNKTLQVTDIFRRRIRGFVTDLKVIQERLFLLVRQSKTATETLDVLGNVEQVYLEFQFLREEKDRKHQLIFRDLFAKDFFLESSEVITNLWWQTRAALKNAQEGKDLRGFEVRLGEAVNRLTEIHDLLRELVKSKGETATQTTAANESQGKIQRADINKICEAAKQGAREGRRREPRTYTAPVVELMDCLYKQDQKLPKTEKLRWKGIIAELTKKFPKLKFKVSAVRVFYSNYVRRNKKT